MGQRVRDQSGARPRASTCTMVCRIWEEPVDRLLVLVAARRELCFFRSTLRAFIDTARFTAYCWNDRWRHRRGAAVRSLDLHRTRQVRRALPRATGASRPKLTASGEQSRQLQHTRTLDCFRHSDSAQHGLDRALAAQAQIPTRASSVRQHGACSRSWYCGTRCSRFRRDGSAWQGQAGATQRGDADYPLSSGTSEGLGAGYARPLIRCSGHDEGLTHSSYCLQRKQIARSRRSSTAGFKRVSTKNGGGEGSSLQSHPQDGSRPSSRSTRSAPTTRRRRVYIHRQRVDRQYRRPPQTFYYPRFSSFLTPGSAARLKRIFMPGYVWSGEALTIRLIDPAGCSSRLRISAARACTATFGQRRCHPFVDVPFGPRLTLHSLPERFTTARSERVHDGR